MVYLSALLFSFIFSLNTLAQDFSIEATATMEEGLKVNEALLEFIEAHPCETGLIDTCDRPLSSQDIGHLKSLLLDLGEWKNHAFNELLPKVNVLKNLPFTIKAGNALNVQERTRLSGKYLEVTYNPKEEASRQFAQSVRISAVTKLVLYDHFFRLAELLSKAKKIRSILTYDMRQDGQVIHETYALAMDEKLWKETERAVDFLKEEKKLRSSDSQTANENYFEQYLEKSFTGSRMKEKDFAFRLRTVLFLDRVASQTRFFEAIDQLVGKISKIFGNTVGKVQTRDGKLKVLAKNPEVMKSMKKVLRPLDILFEKTPFRLTDKFIPGYYGHVAIWLGTPEELMEMSVVYKGEVIPLLDHPKMLPYLERMSQGELVVEALREPGVTMNTLEHFMDIDDFLVIQSTDKSLTPAEHILRAIDQVGKPYDFNFDIETENAIVCSELVYTVFNDLEWPVDVSMGRYTISPDHVAWKSMDYCFAPKLMYVDGKEITSNMNDELRRVLELPGGISYSSTGSCR